MGPAERRIISQGRDLTEIKLESVFSVLVVDFGRLYQLIHFQIFKKERPCSHILLLYINFDNSLKNYHEKFEQKKNVRKTSIGLIILKFLTSQGLHLVGIFCEQISESLSRPVSFPFFLAGDSLRPIFHPNSDLSKSHELPKIKYHLRYGWYQPDPIPVSRKYRSLLPAQNRYQTK